MKRARAQEIVDSHGVIAVNYQNLPVWIGYLDQDRDQAQVVLLDTNEYREVPLSELYEDGSIDTI